MSYDLDLFQLPPGANPANVLGDLFDDELSEYQLEHLVAKKEERKEAVTRALTSEDSDLVVFPMDYDTIAASRRISREEARIAYRHVELHEAHDPEGIQIAIYDDFVTVAVPYNHEHREASEMFQDVWKYLQKIERETGYVTYDPQLDCILDLSSDYDTVLSHFIPIADDVPRILAQAAGEKAPWWRFWQEWIQ